MREIVIPPDFESWRAAARGLLEEGIAPSDLTWRETASGPIPPRPVAPGSAGEFRVPRAFVELAREAARHRDPARWGLLYSVLWRLLHGDRDLLDSSSDLEVVRLRRMRDERPDLVPAPPALSASLFPELSAPATPIRVEEPPGPSARPFVPAAGSIAELREAAIGCRGCDLYRDATQTVFGEGPQDTRLVFVGEAPGDQEDRRGRPFVGPAGEVFDRALAEAGLDRREVYVTNAVKHFKFIVQRGGRRIHQTPRSIEIGACRPWLAAELAAIAPRLLVCLGATAAKALLGPDFRLMKERGQFIEGTGWALRVMATLHPSAVLRGEDAAAQERLYGFLLEDLRKVKHSLEAKVVGGGS